MTFRIVRGAATSSARGKEARRKIDRELHGVTLAAPVAPDPSWYDLRRGRTHPYGCLLWFIDRLIRVGTPRWVVEIIPAVILAYIADQYGDDTGEEASYSRAS